MEMLRDDMTYRQLLLLPHHNVNTNSTSSSHDDQTNNNAGGSIIIVPKPDEVTFGTVLAACERSGEWETLLNVAKAAMEYGVKLDGMALTSVLHSCQQLGLAGESQRSERECTVQHYSLNHSILAHSSQLTSYHTQQLPQMRRWNI